MTATKRDVPDCEQVVRSLWEYLDRRLDREDLVAIDEHLACCDGCRTHVEFEARLMKTLAELRRHHSDPARLRSDVLDALREAGMGTDETG